MPCPPEKITLSMLRAKGLEIALQQRFGYDVVFTIYLPEEDRRFSSTCPVRLFFWEGKWNFERWSYTPGPGPDDIQCEVASLDWAIYWSYLSYFGSPTLFADWIVPFHRFPDWTPAKLLPLIESAKHVSLPEWTSIQEDCNRKLDEFFKKGIRDWEIRAPYYFYELEHSSLPCYRMRIRRDFSEAFIYQTIP